MTWRPSKRAVEKATQELNELMSCECSWLDESDVRRALRAAWVADHPRRRRG